MADTDTFTISAEVELERLWQDERSDNQCRIELGGIQPTWHPHRYTMQDGTTETDLDWACELYLIWGTDRGDLIAGDGHGADWVEYRWRFTGPTLSDCVAAALAWVIELSAFAPEDDDDA